MNDRWSRVVGVALAGVLALAGIVLPAGVATAASDGTVTIDGHGYGHGRGMGQYGAYGYAKQGYAYDWILGHFYGGTSLGAGGIDNPWISVELSALTGATPIVSGNGLVVNGSAVGDGSVMLVPVGASALQLYSGPGCSGPWTPVRVVASGAVVDTSDSFVTVCTAAETRSYHGALRVYGGGTTYTQNLVPLESYLRGVVPREMPASWGSTGGMEALKAQAVAARSYALAYGSTSGSGATICDTTACQVYGGAEVRPAGGSLIGLESTWSNDAVAATANQALWRGGAVIRTEFSSSTGGWTAGGTFPAVADDGDTVSPYHSWTVSTTMSAVAAALGTGPIRTIDVTGRNGLGDQGGRVTQVTVVSTSGARTVFTGSQVRTRLGLRSDWFALSGVSAAAAGAVVRALYNDVLGRDPDPAGASYWTARVTATGDAGPVVDGIAMSRERLSSFVTAQYQSALRRGPEPAGLDYWIGYLGAGAGVPQLQSAIYASPESLDVLGGGDVRTWFAVVYQNLLGRAPAPSELDYWTAYAQANGRGAAVRWIATSPECGLSRLNGYYRTFLGRDVDPSGVASWLPLMADRGDFVLPRILGSSPEYWARAQVRFP